MTKVGLRASEGSPGEFEVVVQDPRLGPFAVHEDFALDVEEGNGEPPRWSVISLAALKHRVAKASVTPAAPGAFLCNRQRTL